jgi:hypothetical protein
MKTEVKTATITCDGCKRTVEEGKGAHRRWRHMNFTVTGGSLSAPHAHSLDYCPECQARVVLPGVVT